MFIKMSFQKILFNITLHSYNIILTTGDISVFAPTNQAFDALPEGTIELLEERTDLLRIILRHHVATEQVLSSELKNEQLLDTYEEDYIRINIYKKDTVITADGCTVSNPDNTADNGVVHVMDQVIFPIPALTIKQQMTYYSEVEDELFFFNSIVDLAGLGPALQGPGPFTVFAPTDDAFAALGDDILDQIFQDPEVLLSVISYHVVEGTKYTLGFSNQTIVSISGQPIDVTVDNNGISLNNNRLGESNVGTLNGVLHLLNGVLLPPSVTVNDMKK